MKLKDKAETISALGGSLALSLFVWPPMGLITAGAWSVWRGYRWYKNKLDKGARERGYKNYEDLKNRNRQ